MRKQTVEGGGLVGWSWVREERNEELPTDKAALMGQTQQGVLRPVRRPRRNSFSLRSLSATRQSHNCSLSLRACEIHGFASLPRSGFAFIGAIQYVFRKSHTPRRAYCSINEVDYCLSKVFWPVCGGKDCFLLTNTYWNHNIICD